MNCDPLASTGLSVNVGLFLIVAITCLLAGSWLLLLTRKKGRAALTGGLTVVLLIAGGVALAPAPPAQAATSECASADNSLTVIQTSTMADLAPGTAPVTITGLVRNNGAESTHIAIVLVEITSITPSPGAPAGTCDASDYVLVGARMPVEETLNPGSSTPFAGASIGFVNKVVNQDACKLATVHLLYTANPA